MVIYVQKIVPAADTASQGELLFKQLSTAFEANENVTLSFEGIDTATSSFVNTALVQLLDRMTFDSIKKRLKVVSSTRQINEMIKRRLSREAEQPAA
jgi:hypothetical protein